MSLEKLLTASRKFPPGYINSSQWPRLSGLNLCDKTYDPPRYEISGKLKLHLVSYYEEEIYFSREPGYIMPRDQEDGVVKPGAQNSCSKARKRPHASMSRPEFC